jgi:Indole-3-glycerol phosphate synthase
VTSQERTERKRAGLRQLAPIEVRGLTPALRDFAQTTTTHRTALAMIVELSPGAPASLLAAIDDTDTAAIAIELDLTAHALAPPCQGSTPVLVRDWVVGKEQVYRARLLGADAVLLSAGAVAPGELKGLLEIAASLHMAAPVEVANAGELAIAAAVGARQVVLSDEGLIPQLPRTLSAIVRGPFAAPSQLEPLQGRVDAVWPTGGALEREADPAGWLRSFIAVAEGGS